MVASGETTLELNTILRVLVAEVRDLPDRAQTWDAETEEDQIVFSLEWDELMDRLSGLETTRREGVMTSDQEQTYCQLLHELDSALPIIERLSLERQPVSLKP